LFGCAGTQTNTIGGYENNMETGLSVYHQYIITSISTNKNEKIIETTYAFKADLNEDIPSNVVKLSLTMLVVNPYKVNFEVWENIQFTNLDTDKVYLKHKKLRHNSQLLPEEFVSVDLPLVLDEYSQVIFSVDILSESGKLLYSTHRAEYKIGSTNN
jgi:hypothetical protein